MSVQRPRRWSNIVQMLYKVFCANRVMAVVGHFEFIHLSFSGHISLKPHILFHGNGL